MDVEKILASIAIVAGAFKAVTSGLKDLNDIAQAKKRNKKRRSPAKKKRRK